MLCLCLYGIVVSECTEVQFVMSGLPEVTQYTLCGVEVSIRWVGRKLADYANGSCEVRSCAYHHVHEATDNLSKDRGVSESSIVRGWLELDRNVHWRGEWFGVIHPEPSKDLFDKVTLADCDFPFTMISTYFHA